MRAPRGHDSIPMQRVRDALERHGCQPRPAGRGYMAYCPAHEADGSRHKRSLSLSEGRDGGALIYCFAGCRTDAIMAAIGLSTADLMPDDSRPAPLPKAASSPPEAQPTYPTAQQAIAVYTARFGRPPDNAWQYHDDCGNLAGVVLRWNLAAGKEIRPVARYPDGKWYCRAMPPPRPLYRLPAVLQAPPDEPIWVVEGEKAADAAVQLGLQATTSAGGAKAAEETDWKPLRGRSVFIIPDNDAAGKQYAETVARLAHAAGAREIRIVDLAAYAPGLPEGGDIADILAASDWCGLPLGDAAEPSDLGQLLLRLADETEPLKPLEPEPPADMPPAWEPFPTAALPEPVRSLVERGATAIGCDPSFLALPALTVCAAAIGSTRRIELKRGWAAPAILWTALVGESGTAKTPALRLVLRPVHELQQRALERYNAAMAQFAAERMIHEKAMADWKRDKDAMSDPPQQLQEPQAERYLVSDTTVEALAPILQNNPRGVLLARDELHAWVGSFDRYAARGGADAAYWLSMHNGGAVLVDRKTGDRRTIYIPTAVVSITGGITPGVLRLALNTELKEAGLLARLLVAYPPRRAKQWRETDIDAATLAPFTQLIETLYSWQPDADEAGQSRPVVVRLSAAAKDHFVKFYNANAQEQVLLEGDLAAAWSKLEEYAARLALVVHCIRVATGDRALTNAGVIDAASMEAAIVLVEWFKREARRVHAMLVETEEDARRRKLVEWIIARGGSVTVRDVTRGPRQFRGDADDAEAALNDLVQAGFGRWETIPANQKGGPPKRVFRLVTEWRRRQNLKKWPEFGGSVAVASVAVANNAPRTTHPQPLCPPVVVQHFEGLSACTKQAEIPTAGGSLPDSGDRRPTSTPQSPSGGRQEPATRGEPPAAVIELLRAGSAIRLLEMPAGGYALIEDPVNLHLRTKLYTEDRQWNRRAVDYLLKLLPANQWNQLSLPEQRAILLKKENPHKEGE